MERFTIHFPVQMNESVSESSHFLEGRDKVRRDQRCFSEDNEGVGIVLGRAQGLSGNQMIGQIETNSIET